MTFYTSHHQVLAGQWESGGPMIESLILSSCWMTDQASHAIVAISIDTFMGFIGIVFVMLMTIYAGEFHVIHWVAMTIHTVVPNAKVCT
jgi:hypothetical protein